MKIRPGDDQPLHDGYVGWFKDKVCVDSLISLNMTMAGVYAHMSAMKDGETLKIPEI